MRFNFTELPVFVDHDIYSKEIKVMSDRMLSTGMVHSVFQVGGVSNPGISDIDLLVVFKDDVEYLGNPVTNLALPGKYLFTHKLFGTCKKYATGIEKYTFFNNYKFISGEEINMKEYSLNSNEISILKTQIALEYLIKAFIAIQLGIEYRTIKVRSFLLHAKAIKYDFEFLGITNEKYHNVINQVIALRSEWFNHKVKNVHLEDMVLSYRDTLLEVITLSLNKYSLFLPVQSPYKLSRNIKLIQSDKVLLERSGLLPMYLLSLESPLLIKLLNRVNSFKIHVPYMNENIPDILKQRHEFMEKAFSYNGKYLPNFICTGHGLNTFS